MTSVVSIQNSLAAGELSPALYGRIDLEKWHSGTSTCRNFFVNYRGGVASRAGLAYVGTCKQPGTASPPRDIPFQFSVSQGYVLEFGDQYMRIKTNGAYVTEAAKTVTGVNSAGKFTTSGVHGYSVGDWVYDVGNTNFSGLTWIVATTPTTSTFTVTDLFGTVISSATVSGAGTVARIYTVTAPYAAVDLPYLKFTQSADTMTLCCVNQETGTEYPSYSLVRSGQTNWVFTQESFGTIVSPPTGLTATATSSTTPSTWYTYVVTSVNSLTTEESVASAPVYVFNNDISISAGSNILKWSNVAAATSYNVYASVPSYGVVAPIGGVYGFIGSSVGNGFVDTNILPDFSVPPPTNNDPFVHGGILDVVPTAAGSNYSQNTVGFNITTSTGTGFSGTPVVVNSQFVGFAIANKGKNYAPADTITITDSGGGTASGFFEFGSNPTNKSVMTINGTPIEFVVGTFGLSNQQTTIYSTIALTLQNLANTLNNSQIFAWQVATYTFDGDDDIIVTYKTQGSGGNAFTLSAGTVTGLTVSGATLTGGGTAGTGATATLTIGPTAGTYPSVPAYYQQRRVYANSTNNPDTYWMSKPGLYTNMDYSLPSVETDFITGNPWAQQVNGIQWLVPMPGGLVTLTGKGAWQINGGANSIPVTPSNQFATPQAYNGCNFTVPPIVVNYDILYVQQRGNVVRDLSYNFFVNIYTGTDLTVLSNHLFINTQIKQWCWAEEPWKLIWVLKSDGQLLSLTYLKEQEIYAWSRHDTNGLFVSIASITESPNTVAGVNVLPFVDAVYVITKRYVAGGWRYYSERMNDRLWHNVEDSFCADSALTNQINSPNATLTPSAITGTVIFTASSAVFTSANVGDVIRIGGGKATVTVYTSTTQVTGDITETITDTIPDDPNLLPVPAKPGFWTISTPITVVKGLNHINGLRVSILADGSVVDDSHPCGGTNIVCNNQITLPYAASKIVIGLPYICQVQTLYCDHPDPEGTSQNKRKLISSVGLRVEQSRGMTVGTDQPDQSTLSNSETIPWTDMNEVKDRTMNAFAGSAVPLFTGDYYKNVSSSWGLKGQLAVQQLYPLPASLLSVILYWSTGDDR